MTLLTFILFYLFFLSFHFRMPSFCPNAYIEIHNNNNHNIMYTQQILLVYCIIEVNGPLSIKKNEKAKLSIIIIINNNILLDFHFTTFYYYYYFHHLFIMIIRTDFGRIWVEDEFRFSGKGFVILDTGLCIQ